MVELVDRQICFRLADAVPAASPPGQFRLGDAAAEALSELLQVFVAARNQRRTPLHILEVRLSRTPLVAGWPASRTRN